MTTGARIEISRDDIEIEERYHRQTDKPYWILTFHKPGWPSIAFESGGFRKESLAQETREAIFAWLREIGVEVTP